MNKIDIPPLSSRKLPTTEGVFFESLRPLCAPSKYPIENTYGFIKEAVNEKYQWFEIYPKRLILSKIKVKREKKSIKNFVF